MGLIPMIARQRGTTSLGRFTRRWRFDRNPLRRGTDRVESAVIALLLAALVIGAPFAALAAGAWALSSARHAQAAQQAGRQQVTAVVLSVTKSAASGSDLAWQASARWVAPDGRAVTHEVPVVYGTVPGDRVPVWSDHDGGVTDAPMTDDQVSAQQAAAQALAVIAVLTAAMVAGALSLHAIDKRRMAAWDADWQATGPHWTPRA